MRGAALGLGLGLLAAACDGKTGTYHVALVAAPGSHVLDPATRGRLVLSDPPTIVEADRAADGSFALDLTVDAAGASGDLLFEGLDAAGQIVAWGRTPPLPIAAIDATLRIYVAAPMTFAAAPVALDPPRADLAIAPLAYGALFAGGTDAAGAARADLVIYDTYDHQLQQGLDLPAPRTKLAAVTGSTGFAYLFGGADAAGNPTASYWRFDTTVAPAGQYLDLTSATTPDLARAGAAAAAIGGEQFVVTGAPPILLDGLGGRAAKLTMPASIGGLAATAVVGASLEAVFVGDGAGAHGVSTLSASGYVELATAPADAVRTHHAIVTAPDGSVIAIGGADATGPLATAIRVDPTAMTATSIAGALATPRRDAAAAATGSLLIVAGGTDAAGTVLGDAEVLALPALTHMTTIPLAFARTGATALALPNGQILLAGGRDAAGAPVGAIELFTPAAPTGL